MIESVHPRLSQHLLPYLTPFISASKKGRSVVTLILLYMNKYPVLPFSPPQKIYTMDPPSISAQHTTDKKLIHKSLLCFASFSKPVQLNMVVLLYSERKVGKPVVV